MTSLTIDTSLMQQWIAEKLSIEAVEQNLVQLGYDEHTYKAYLKEFRKLRNAKRLVKGFIYLSAGAFLGFLSCILTMINPVPELYNWILFGLTSIAILLICYGLYQIFE